MSEILIPGQEEYIKSFRHEKDPLILEMEEYAAENRVPILDWHSAEFMEQLITFQKPKRVLEIGTAIAYSSIRIARNLGKKARLFTIEKSEDNYQKAKANIAKADLEDKIKIVFGDARDVMPKLSKKFDFIFLDADKEDYRKLFDYSLLLLKKNGIIFVDNLLWHGMAAAQDVPPSFVNSTGHIRSFNHMFMSQPNLRTSIISIGDGIGLGIRIK